MQMADRASGIEADRATLKRVLPLTFLAIVLDGFDSQALGFALPALIKDWQLPKSAFAPVLSISLIGMTIGSAVAGVVGDRIGRRLALTFCVALFGMMTALSAMSSDLLQLTVLRFVAAAGLGGAMPNAAALIGEVAPARSRSVAISAIAVCVPLGGVLGGLVSASLLPAIGWRGLFLVAGIIPLFYSGILFLALPESPGFVASRAAGGPKVANSNRRLSELFHPEFRRDTLALSAGFFFCLLSVYACFNWLPTLIVDSGQDIAVASFGLTLFNVGGVIAAIGGGWLVGRVGSKILLLTMFGVAAVVALALTRTVDHVAGMLILLTMLGGAVAGAQSVLTAVAAQAYPLGLRAAGVGLTIGFGRLGGIASAFLGAIAISVAGLSGFGAMIAVASVAGILAMLLLRHHVERFGSDDGLDEAEAAPPIG
jgi:AAHS family 4-hydroxybenzoate transporter-like MFS transporter